MEKEREPEIVPRFSERVCFAGREGGPVVTDLRKPQSDSGHQRSVKGV
jgi:hypothetical protein